MNIGSIFPVFNPKTKNSLLSKKRFNNLSPLRKDTVSFSGKGKSDNPGDYENFKKRVLSISENIPAELIDTYYQEFLDHKEEAKRDFDEEAIEDFKKSNFFKTEYIYEELAFYYLKSYNLQFLIDMITVDLPEKKRMPAKFIDKEKLMECYPFAKELLEERGIKSADEFNKYIKYIQNPNGKAKKIFADTSSHLPGVSVFSKLSNKDDLENYSELLHHLYFIDDNEESESALMNGTTKFLKKIGVFNFTDFDKKFDYLAPKYNNFKTVSDKYNAIMDIQEEYPQKIDFIKGLAKDFPEKIKIKSDQDAEILYSQNNNIIDYIYSNRFSKDYTNKLSNYVDFLSNFNKLTPKVLALLPEIKDFSNSENVFGFMEMLAETNVKTDELLYMAQNHVVEGANLFRCIVYKEDITNQISTVLNIPLKDAEYIYLNFANEYSALISETENKENPNPVFDELIEKDEIVKNFTEILEKYGVFKELDFNNYPNKYNPILKNFIMSLGYNEILNGKGQTQANKFTNFIASLRLFDSKEELDEIAKSMITQKESKQDKKAKNIKSNTIKPFAYKKTIEAELKTFENIKDSIVLYLDFDESDFFEGKTALEGYKLYRRCDKSATAIYEKADKKFVYENIRNILNSYKSGQVFDLNLSRKLQELIPDRKSFEEFAKNNNINFIASDSNRDENYIENCLKILDLVKDNDKALKFFTKSDFIKLSKEELNKFFNNYESKEAQKEVLEGIANAKIRRLQTFESFIKKYSNASSGSSNLIKALNLLPDDMDLQSFKQDFLVPLQKKIREYELPIEIDDLNILNIDIRNIKPLKDYKSYEIVSLINALANKQENCNFASALPYLYKPVESFRPAKSENIINEVMLYESKSPYYYIKKFFDITTGNRENFFAPAESSRSLNKDKIPSEFIDLLNDTSWFTVGDNKIFNMPLHCRMRFIERFIMPEISDISELYTPETKEKMKNLINSIYQKSISSSPDNIKFDANHNNRFGVTFEYGSKKIKTSFTSDGTLLTLFEKLD